MRRPDGLEVLVRLAYPLPITTAGGLLGAIGREAERLGYTDVCIITEGPDSGAIAGRPPEPPGD
jgi:hypothetical protein